MPDDDNDGLAQRQVDKQIQARLRLPLQMIVPIVGTLIVATAAAVWWVHNILVPIDARLTKLEMPRQPATLADGVYPQPVLEQRFLADTDDDTQSSTIDSKTIRDIAYSLQTHPDLVVIVAGYANKELPLAQSVQLSIRRAQTIGGILRSSGIQCDRIFVTGYGYQTPRNFPVCRHTSAAIFVCDIFQVMSRATV